MAGGGVLLLFDEVLNGFSRHKWLAEPMHAFFHVIVRTLVGSQQKAVVFSLPRSQVEMTDCDFQWQEKIVKVGAVAKPLLVNDEAEISEVIRRRLFEDLGSERTRQERRQGVRGLVFRAPGAISAGMDCRGYRGDREEGPRIPPGRFEACYPFHPATLSVFQRKWRPLPQFQQTRGTLAMLAQWISLADQRCLREGRQGAADHAGVGPAERFQFRSVVLGQLGRVHGLRRRSTPTLRATIPTPRRWMPIPRAHCDDIHRRVGTAILFESTGGQIGQGGAPAGAAICPRRARLGHDNGGHGGHQVWRASRSSSRGSEPMASRSSTRPRSTRQSMTARRPSTRTARSSRPFATWSRRSSNAARAFR